MGRPQAFSTTSYYFAAFPQRPCPSVRQQKGTGLDLLTSQAIFLNYAIYISVHAEACLVVLNFTKPCKWLALKPKLSDTCRCVNGGLDKLSKVMGSSEPSQVPEHLNSATK